ncbi:proline--tRNA ligase [Myxococcota bacterium]|nr:proline--tRNA ligase [Myxococcota bacterium]MBU1430988.1 proline--tRNA ligase [Myxococcota bacterium]MBU1897217.1 proline--tRNA ligase [Myxococcota bacterium]
MRMTRLHAPTLKEIPKDAEVPSHQLLMRAGFIRKLSAGIYDYLPLAQRVLKKISDIVREEMDAAGAQEVLLPMVQPAEIWQSSGRWQKYGPELLRLKDRKGNEFCLGPTHEEVIVDMVKRDVRSWRALPLNLYQIQAKFRDEIRPRFGIMRGREFLMKDAYSFDADEAGANASYDAMFAAYNRIFARCGLAFRPVEADTGAIGGSRSHEFQVLAETGEDAIVSCDTCGFAANVEQAELLKGEALEGEPASAPVEAVATPEQRTIEEVSGFLGRPATGFIKTLIVIADDKPYALLLRGDHELNEIKAKKLLGAEALMMADEAQVKAVTGAPVGFAGPVGLEGVEIIADYALINARGCVTGANLADTHLINVDLGRDFEPRRFADLRMAVAGDPCPRCEGKLEGFRGVEVGHVFFLGTRYTEAMGCTFLDERGREQPMVMGCYGIGVSRVMAAAVEQHHDEHGICWPRALAPFEVAVLPLQSNKADVVEAAEGLYAALKAAGIDALLDDRDERAGSKFKDAELIGAPLRVAVGGRGLKEGVVEVKPRRGDKVDVPLDEVVAYIQAQLAAL